MKKLLLILFHLVLLAPECLHGVTPPERVKNGEAVLVRIKNSDNVAIMWKQNPGLQKKSLSDMWKQNPELQKKSLSEKFLNERYCIFNSNSHKFQKYFDFEVAQNNVGDVDLNLEHDKYVLELIEKYKLQKNTNPEIQKLFDRIKNDIGLGEENIQLWIGENNVDGYKGFCEVGLGVVIFPQVTNFDDQKANIEMVYDLIHTLAHELTHYDQFFGITGRSFNQLNTKLICDNNYRESVAQKLEISAEASACMYIDCPICLKKSLRYCPSVTTEKGRLTAKSGYFCQEDAELYIKRAQEEGKLCKYHENEYANFSPLSVLPYDDFLNNQIADFLPDPVAR